MCVWEEGGGGRGGGGALGAALIFQGAGLEWRRRRRGSGRGRRRGFQPPPLSSRRSAAAPQPWQSQSARLGRVRMLRRRRVNFRLPPWEGKRRSAKLARRCISNTYLKNIVLYTKGCLTWYAQALCLRDLHTSTVTVLPPGLGHTFFLYSKYAYWDVEVNIQSMHIGMSR